jgi:PAS domain-containing protein
MQTGIVRLNASLAKICDLQPGTDTITLGHLWRTVPNEHRNALYTRLAEALRSREPFEIDYPITLGNGAARWVRMRGETDFNSQGILQRVHGVSFDVSAERASEEQRSRSEGRYRALVEATTALTWSADASGAILLEGSQWETVHGTERGKRSWLGLARRRTSGRPGGGAPPLDRNGARRGAA